MVADLLIALRKAGAEQISPPVCATCGKPLRTLQRRGQDWYCAVCGPRPRRCAACGQDRIIATLDRQGRPRCGGCPDQDGPDPLVVLAEVVTGLDPSLQASAVHAAARRMFARPAKLRQLAWVVEDHPELLTGAGAKAPIPAVLRLIDELLGNGHRPAGSACPAGSGRAGAASRGLPRCPPPPPLAVRALRPGVAAATGSIRSSIVQSRMSSSAISTRRLSRSGRSTTSR